VRRRNLHPKTPARRGPGAQRTAQGTERPF